MRPICSRNRENQKFSRYSQLQVVHFALGALLGTGNPHVVWATQGFQPGQGYCYQSFKRVSACLMNILNSRKIKKCQILSYVSYC